MWSLWSCGRPWSVCEVVFVPYVDAVVAVTVVYVLLLLHVCMLIECEGDGNVGVADVEGVVALSAACECVGGTRGSRFVSSADDVQEMSVVSGVRGIGGVCEMCMCLARGEG